MGWLWLWWSCLLRLPSSLRFSFFSTKTLVTFISLVVVLETNSAQRCIGQQPSEPKYFYYGDQAVEIKILTSDRTTHLLISTILQIFTQEVLGYNNTTLIHLDDQTQGFDPDAQFSYISSCTDFNCQNLDEVNSKSLAPLPKAMINMEMWLPPNFQVHDWKVEDLGRLGLGGRFGWFIPNAFAQSTPPIKDHWRSFSTNEVANLFAPTSHVLNFILKNLKRSDGSDRFVCQEDYCDDRGMYVSSQCRHVRHGTNGPTRCALMLTDFPVHSSLYSTMNVINQIEDLSLQVNVAFVGDKLLETIQYLETSPEIQNGSRSYLVFHYTPSLVTSRFNFTSIKFEPCDHGWESPIFTPNLTLTSPNCLYNLNRLAKVVWQPLRDGAQALYLTLSKMEFSLKDYQDILGIFNEKSKTFWDPKDPQLLREVACQWLNEETMLRNGLRSKQYQQWSDIGTSKPKLIIGGIFPIRGTKFRAPELLPVALRAQKDVNSNSTILANYDLQLIIYDGQCTADVVMKRFIDIITHHEFKSKIVGILGPACSDTIQPIAGVSKHFRSVVITYSAEGSIKDAGESQYPYFFRTIAENKQYKYVYLEIFKKFRWSKVASLTLDGHKYSEYISHLQDVLQTHGINFIMNRKFPKESPDMSMYLRDLKERGARIIIGEFFERAARVIMCEAFKQGMTQKQGYVWFLPGWYHNDWFDVDVLREEGYDDEFMPNCSTAQMIEAISGHLTLIHATYANDDELMQNGTTVGQWKNTMNQELRRSRVTANQLNKYSGYVYDAVWLYALALDRLIKQNKSYIQDIHSDRSINEFVDIIGDTDFVGVTGRINFPNGHSRLSNIKIIQWYGNTSYEVGIYEPDYATISGNGGKLLVWNDSLIQWQTSDGSLPNDHSKDCSILSNFATALNVECEEAIILAFIIGFGVLLAFLVLTFFFFKRRYERKMRHTEERMRALGLLTPTSLLTLDEWEIPRDRVVINRKLGEGAFGTVFGGEAFFDEKGWVAVAVKTLKTGSSVEEKIDFLSEADMMKRFDHKNIVKLLGVCTRNEPVYTVMEFMLYGDLKTYLLARRHLVNERNREEMDEVSNRKLTSMALDVSRGLSYLAELKYVHRDVACRNCLVNSSRVVKLADFGMARPMYENDYYRFNKKGMLPVRWMAPESLADGLFTPMSDVWSYGVLLYEMITFGSFPFQGLSNNQVLEHVKAGNTLTIPAGIKSQLETLLRSCWQKTPTKRPTAAEIAELLSNNPRLISPCIDVPLASVQVERTDSLELIPSMVRKPSGTTSSRTNAGGLTASKKSSSNIRENNSVKELSMDGPYSPLNGIANGSPQQNPFRFELREPFLSGENSTKDGDTDSGLMLLGTRSPQLLGTCSSSPFVPPGYIMLDHRGGDHAQYVPSSISST